MAYEVPRNMLAEWDIPSDAPVLRVMADTLGKITAAVAEWRALGGSNLPGAQEQPVTARRPSMRRIAALSSNGRKPRGVAALVEAGERRLWAVCGAWRLRRQLSRAAPPHDGFEI